MLTAEPPAGIPSARSSALSDLELCGSCGGGSRAAFSEVVTRYHGPLLAYCGRLVGEDHAEDVLQHTLLKAWLALAERGAEVTNLRGWLYRIAHNQAMDHLRKAGAPWDELDCEWESPESTERAVEAAERLGRVSAGIRELPNRQREALLMHSLEGDSYADIAVKMETNVPVVSQLITRARARLREIPALVPGWFVVRRLAGSARRATAGLSGGSKAAVIAATIATGASLPLVADHAGRDARPQAPGASAVALAASPSAARPVSAPRHAARSRRTATRKLAKGESRSIRTSGPAGGIAATPPAADSHSSAPAKEEITTGTSHGHRSDTSGTSGRSTSSGPQVSGGVSISTGVPGVATVDVISGVSTTPLRLPTAGVPVSAPALPALPLNRRRASALRRGLSG